MTAFSDFGERDLETLVEFGRGNASTIPGDSSQAAVTLTNNTFDLSDQGVPEPWGTMGNRVSRPPGRQGRGCGHLLRVFGLVQGLALVAGWCGMAMTPQWKHELAVRRPDAGIGLIAVMVAITLLSVGILSLTQVLTQSVSMQSVSSQRTIALDIARAYMEDVKGRDPLTLVTESLVQVNEKRQVDSGGVFTRQLTIASVALHLVSATVVVTLPRSNPIELVTWIYDGVY